MQINRFSRFFPGTQPKPVAVTLLAATTLFKLQDFFIFRTNSEGILPHRAKSMCANSQKERFASSFLFSELLFAEFQIEILRDSFICLLLFHFKLH